MNCFDSEAELIDNLTAKPYTKAKHLRSNSLTLNKTFKLHQPIITFHFRSHSSTQKYNKKRHVSKKVTLDSATTQDTQTSSTGKPTEKIIPESDTIYYIPPSPEEIRFSYLSKLIYKGLWNPNKKKKPLNTIIILDWDDTLLCTSRLIKPYEEINKNILDSLNEKEKDIHNKTEQKVYNLLSKCISQGDTFIITNAEPGWVEYTSNIFYPSICELLTSIKIISARGEYESYYPGNVRMWKIAAFNNIVKHYDSEVVTNIMCIGDSFLEIEAGKNLGKYFVYNVVKTVKFNASPKLEDLNLQLGLVIENFDYIVRTPKNWTIKVNKKQNVKKNK